MSDLFGNGDGNSHYEVYIDQRWQLDDLTEFSKAYEESYFAIFGLMAIEHGQLLGVNSFGRVSRAFKSYPWRGGYSAVNFFRELKKSVPRAGRPTIRQIQYASPGVIELLLDQNVAIQIGTVVGTICGSAKLANSTIHRIYRDYIDRQLARISVEKAEIDLSRDEMNFIRESNDELGEILGLEEIGEIDRATGHPLRTLKIQLAILRRVRKLAKLQEDGKIKLSDHR